MWNEGLKDECARVAVAGLEFHPDSPELLRRKAHGHRQNGEISEAVEIEIGLFEAKSDKLILIDTIIYLVRGLCDLEDWQRAMEYIEEGLKIDPDQEELRTRRELVKSNIDN